MYACMYFIVLIYGADGLVRNVGQTSKQWIQPYLLQMVKSKLESRMRRSVLSQHFHSHFLGCILLVTILLTFITIIYQYKLVFEGNN